MTANDRKAAIDAYKRRKIVGGVYAVTCVPTGAKWIGAANDLHGAKNRIWFSLNYGGTPWPDLEAAWRQHGAARFTYEEIDLLEDGLSPFEREMALKERLADWKTRLGASTI
jgi:hypothetical protein